MKCCQQKVEHDNNFKPYETIFSQGLNRIHKLGTSSDWVELNLSDSQIELLANLLNEAHVNGRKSLARQFKNLLGIS